MNSEGTAYAVPFLHAREQTIADSEDGGDYVNGEGEESTAGRCSADISG